MLLGRHFDGYRRRMDPQCERSDDLSEKAPPVSPPTQETVPREHRRVPIRRAHPDADTHVPGVASRHQRVVPENALQLSERWLVQSAAWVVDHEGRVQSSIFSRQRLQRRKPEPVRQQAHPGRHTVARAGMQATSRAVCTTSYEVEPMAAEEFR